MRGVFSAKSSDYAWEVPGYRFLKQLGTGASGRVVQAVHQTTSAAVAIKYLSPELRSSPDFLESFRAEARLLASLNSEHVVRLYGYSEARTGAAIVMELVQGVSLRILLREHGATTPESALAILKGSLLGLGAAHSAGVVHRDYKPANVLVTVQGESKLADFGIAVRSGAATQAVGTPAYMAPEQWRADPVTPGADIYAATATFFECLAGSQPYAGSTLAELALAHCTAPIPVAQVPDSLRPLITWGMAKAPADRPADASAFLDELERTAGAAYGSGWEKRGIGALAAAVALLPLLIPATGSVAAGSTELATTVLSPSRRPAARGAAHSPGIKRIPAWAARTAGAAVVVVTGVTSVVVAVSDNHAPRPQHRASPSPPAGTLAESPKNAPGSPGHSASPSSSPSPAASASDTDTAPAGQTASSSPEVNSHPGSGEPTGTDGKDYTSGTAGAGITNLQPTASTSPAVTAGSEQSLLSPPVTPPKQPSPTTSASTTIPNPPVRVSFLGLTSLAATSNGRADAGILVRTNTPAPVTVAVTWFAANANSTASSPGKQDGAAQTFVLSGNTQYTLNLGHTFDPTFCTRRWGVLLSSSPLPEHERPYRHIPSNAC
ncbi:serine/threonine-protein kinase [Streptomyces sp. NPDC056534]|uniref:serine/threonine-protein kinase n=1 Tax=Streptomyces sp. NPDC056534 TaxID=3345857 RepID=UPI00367A769D